MTKAFKSLLAAIGLALVLTISGRGQETPRGPLSETWFSRHPGVMSATQETQVVLVELNRDGNTGPFAFELPRGHQYGSRLELRPRPAMPSELPPVPEVDLSSSFFRMRWTNLIAPPTLTVPELTNGNPNVIDPVLFYEWDEIHFFTDYTELVPLWPIAWPDMAPVMGPVPEPTTLGLLALGGAGVWWMGRRKRR